ncbi:hypothetical protein [Dickeya zeae]|uniref:hypothetical protein n=1 Tax=Dickeya zeae TaxID=204042 RepID=UPI00205F2FDB|nr:hypothetical protein [Dickeya zeae]UPT55496.1 hypothetical protein FGI00_07990 [Dickeya zeae]
MSVESHGNENRVAGRDFYESSITVDKINIAIPAANEEKRPLVPAQRKQLNQLVKEIADGGYEEGFSVWQRVHAEIGVKSIEDMTVNQYQTAFSYLQALRDRHREKDASNALVHLLLKNTQQVDQRQQLIHYCHIHFGTGRLTELTRSQLQQALSWLDDRQCSTVPEQAAPNARQSWQEVLKAEPLVFSAVFAAGMFLGIFLFR